MLLAAGVEVYRHTQAKSDWTKCPNCAAWSPIGPKGTGVLGGVKRIAVDSASDTYFVGMSSGQIWGSSAGVGWHKIFTHPTGRPVTGLVVDPHEPSRVWVTFEGTGPVDGPHRVWLLERIESDGGGDVGPPLVYWQKTNVTANLPSELALGQGWFQSNMLALDPNLGDTLYVGTDKGVYRGVGTLIEGEWSWNWQPFSCGLPRTYVTDLEEVHPVTEALYAATFGRGLFATSLFSPEIEVDASDDPARDAVP